MVQLFEEELQLKNKCLSEKDYLSMLENMKEEIESLINSLKTK